MASRSAFATGLAALAAVTPAHAQQPVQLPPLHVQAPDTNACVDLEAQGSRSLSFDCLNRQLQNSAAAKDTKAPDMAAKDVTGTGAPTSVGTFSYTATAIRMGNAFGKSATPQRPPQPRFTSTLVTPHLTGGR